MTIGVLALQGGFAAHLRVLAELGLRARAVHYPEDLAELDGLILPGGESTTQLDLVRRLDLLDDLERLRAREVPVLATCAGAILVAKSVEPTQPSLAWLDIHICRNAYGRQLDSFATRDDGGDLPLVFIRAPKISRVGDGVDVLATLRGEPVLVRGGSVVAATFHPELTASRTIHRWLFLGRAGPLGHEGRVLHDVEEDLAHRSEHVGG